MDLALAVAIFALGAAAGGLIVGAWKADRSEPFADIHSSHDDLERRARRVQ